MGRQSKIVMFGLEKEVLSLSVNGMGTYQIANHLNANHNLKIDKANVRSFLIEYKKNIAMSSYKEPAYQDETLQGAIEARKTLVKADSVLWAIIEKAEAEGRLTTALRGVNAILRNIRVYSSIVPVECQVQQKPDIMKAAIDFKALLQKLHKSGSITINDLTLLS